MAPECQDALKADSAQPLLSIIVLVYNTAEYLPACLDALLSQAYQPVEIIAIDDASTDGSLEICQEYAARYPNLRCLTKPNEGGAVVGNLGIALARGTYIALVDSDDIVTRRGYELLMQKACETGADIVLGRAARMINGELSADVFLYEPLLWNRPGTFASVNECPDLMYDGFYWNKVFRLEFLRAHGLGMEPGLLYADRPFVHRAYYLSRCTAVIPDLVYLWRERSGAGSSITQNKQSGHNFLDRMESARLEWNCFDLDPRAEWYRQLIAVENLQRALHVLPAVITSCSFREAFMQGMRSLLALYGDLDFRSLGVRRALYLELIRRDELVALGFLLAQPFSGKTHSLGGKCYWDVPWLTVSELGIDPAVMQISFPLPGFFRLQNIHVNGNIVGFTLVIPEEVESHCDITFELQSSEGRKPLTFQFEERVVDGYHYTLDLSSPGERPEGRYGLVLLYESGEIKGGYRIGGALLCSASQAALPMHTDMGGVVLISKIVGGVGVEF